MSTQSKPTMKRSLRGLIWFGALACFFGGFGILHPSADAETSSNATTIALASTGIVSSATCDTTKDPYCDQLDGEQEVTNPAKQTAAACKNQTECRQLAEFTKNPLDLLPAWRWSQAVSTLDNTYGVSDATNGNIIFDMTGRLLLGLSGLLWVVLLGLARLAMLLSPLASDSVGGVVNTAFSAVGSGVSRGLIWIPIVGALLFALIGPIRSKGAASTSSLIILLAVPLGMMWGMMTAVDANTTRVERKDASGNVVKDSNGDTVYDTETVSGIGVGSPVWIARTGTGMIDQLSGFVVSGIGDAFIQERLSPITNPNGEPISPSCVAYTDGMRGAYQLSWNNSTMNKADASAATMQTFSDLWMSTMGTNWVRAQFGGGQRNVGVTTGSTAYGWRVWCHMLENNRDTPIAEQARIGFAGGYPKAPAQFRALTPGTSDKDAAYKCFLESQKADESATAPVGTDCVSQVYGGYLGSSEWSSSGGLDSVNDRQQQMLNWAACSYDSSTETWSLDPAWQAAGAVPAWRADYCSEWWNKLTPSNWKDNGQYFQWSSDGSAISCVSDETCNIKMMYRAMHGKNSGERLFAGVFALLTSGLYFWLLAMLLVGVAISKLGLMLMLVILPFTLFLLALPKWRVDPKKAQRNAMGIKLLKQTFAFATATATLQFVVALILITVGLVRVSLAPLNIYGFTDFLAPIAAYFIVKKLTSIMGLGNIGSAAGAMSLPLAAAAGMGGFALGSGGKSGMAAAKAAAGKGAALPGDVDKLGSKAMSKANALKNGEGKGLAAAVARKLGAGGGAGAGAGSIAALGAAVAAGGAAVAAAKTPEDRAKAMDDLVAAQSALANAKDAAAAKDAHTNKKALDAATAEGRKAELMAAMNSAESASLAAGGTASEAQAAALAAFSAKSAEHRGLDRANELGAGLAAASGGAISAQDAAAAIAGGAMAGYVTLGDGTSMSIGNAVQSGHAAIDPSGGGAMLTAKGLAAGGSMVGMVNMPGGSSMSMADAVTNGLVDVDAATGAVSVSAAGAAAGLNAGMLPSGSMVVAGGAGSPNASALETQTMAYDAVMGSAAGARATADGTAASLGVALGGVSPLRGNAGIIAPAHGSATGFGSIQDLGNLNASLLNSTAATSLLLGSDVTDQLWTACGGDQETYAAACDNALSVAGIRGMTMGAAISNSSLDTPAQNAIRGDLTSGDASQVGGALSTLRSVNGGQGLYGLSSSGLNTAVAAAFAQTSSARQNDVGMLQGGVSAMSSDATNAIGEAAEIFDGYTSGSGMWHDFTSGNPAQKSNAEKAIVGRMVNAEMAVMRTQQAHQAAVQLAHTGFIAPDNTSWDDERARLVDHYSDRLREDNSVMSNTGWLNSSISSMRGDVRAAQVMPTVRPSRPAGTPRSRGVATTPMP